MTTSIVCRKLFFWFATLVASILMYFTFGIIMDTSRMIQNVQIEIDEISATVFRRSKLTADKSNQSPNMELMVKNSLSKIVDDLQILKSDFEKKCGSTTDVGLCNEERINYADQNLGARIHNVIAEPIDGYNILKRMFGMEYSSNPPINMLIPNMNPGSCFGFRGNKSEVMVQLGRPIYIQSIELEHIATEYSPTRETTSAPYVFQVLGKVHLSNKEVSLGLFQYENSQSYLRQAFEVNSLEKYAYIHIKFHQNHGHPLFTCVYHIGIYGRTTI
ncbi:SUN domain-containing protein 5-like [Teleopsis dalmanni]|uniref:SUN domain-containing protein 5-like n=1 Tax=Teleopsis dalmanni TaxID=139649 RepID=UPI000D32A314|nr:SUN domain-containing protein 5-like [Teleopsis dalmanni]XP_037952377.1 SUN domain-containing protein 5-like [Teleopsis dalmanni]XP_037954292.1 SUN domain-containing protein 5-like [Teleopsis dalmanni]